MKEDINRPSHNSGKTLFLIASQAGSDETLKWLYNTHKENLDLFAMDRLGFSALRLAADEYLSALLFFMVKGDDTKINALTRDNFSKVEW